jgi:hypothetical protein
MQQIKCYCGNWFIILSKIVLFRIAYINAVWYAN